MLIWNYIVTHRPVPLYREYVRLENALMYSTSHFFWWCSKRALWNSLNKQVQVLNSNKYFKDTQPTARGPYSAFHTVLLRSLKTFAHNEAAEVSWGSMPFFFSVMLFLSLESKIYMHFGSITVWASYEVLKELILVCKAKVKHWLSVRCLSNVPHECLEWIKFISSFPCTFSTLGLRVSYS